MSTNEEEAITSNDDNNTEEEQQHALNNVNFNRVSFLFSNDYVN